MAPALTQSGYAARSASGAPNSGASNNGTTERRDSDEPVYCPTSQSTHPASIDRLEPGLGGNEVVARSDESERRCGNLGCCLAFMIACGATSRGPVQGEVVYPFGVPAWSHFAAMDKD